MAVKITFDEPIFLSNETCEQQKLDFNTANEYLLRQRLSSESDAYVAGNKSTRSSSLTSVASESNQSQSRSSSPTSVASESNESQTSVDSNISGLSEEQIELINSTSIKQKEESWIIPDSYRLVQSDETNDHVSNAEPLNQFETIPYEAYKEAGFKVEPEKGVLFIITSYEYRDEAWVLFSIENLKTLFNAVEFFGRSLIFNPAQENDAAAAIIYAVMEVLYDPKKDGGLSLYDEQVFKSVKKRLDELKPSTLEVGGNPKFYQKLLGKIQKGEFNREGEFSRNIIPQEIFPILLSVAVTGIVMSVVFLSNPIVSVIFAGAFIAGVIGAYFASKAGFSLFDGENLGLTLLSAAFTVIVMSVLLLSNPIVPLIFAGAVIAAVFIADVIMSLFFNSRQTSLTSASFFKQDTQLSDNNKPKPFPIKP